MHSCSKALGVLNQWQMIYKTLLVMRQASQLNIKYR